jgi:hypothetical protein
MLVLDKVPSERECPIVIRISPSDRMVELRIVRPLK